MSLRHPSYTWAPLALIFVVTVTYSLVGCGPNSKPAAPPAATADDHDHDHDHADHGHPKTLAEGMIQLEAAAETVAVKLAEGAKDAADDAVHLAGHIVDDMQGLLAKDESLAAEAKETAKKALDELFECFDKLDTAMHAGAEEAKETAAEVHESIKEKVAAAMAALGKAFTKETE